MNDIGIVLFLALLVERLVEVIRAVAAPWVAGWPEPRRAALWKALGLAWGLVLAVGLKVNLFALLGAEGVAPGLGMLLSGLFAGMGSEWVHHLLTDLPRLAVEGRKIRLLRKDNESRAQD